MTEGTERESSELVELLSINATSARIFRRRLRRMKVGRFGHFYLLVGLSEVLTAWILCMPSEEPGEGLLGLAHSLFIVVLGALGACIVSLAALLAYTYIFLGIQLLLPGLAATVLSVAVTVFTQYLFDVKYEIVMGLVYVYPGALKGVYLPTAEFMFPLTSFVSLLAGVGITAAGLYVRLRMAYGFWRHRRSYWTNPFLMSMTRQVKPFPSVLEALRRWWHSMRLLVPAARTQAGAGDTERGSSVPRAPEEVRAPRNHELRAPDVAEPGGSLGSPRKGSLPGAGRRRRRAFKAARKVHRRARS